ncbi:MAG: MraZ N-terminal domain containing protein [Chloroflexi bacterium]|nr:MraZ N-terminal domain containing protein [Chloroflexota bacterium]
MQVEERSIDSQGRISLPADWRREHLEQTEDVIIVRHGEDLIIKPKKTEKISTFFDSVEVDLENDLSDWHAIKRELLHPEKSRE